MSQPRGEKNTAFMDNQHAAIGTYAVECGNAAALRKYRPEISDLGESTVHHFNKKLT